MPRKSVLIAGASGLVGYAAMKHFASEPECDVIAVSRREPDETFGAHFTSADLTDTKQCAELFGSMTDVTHVIYAAFMREQGLPLHYPGGPARVAQVVDADLLARCIAWAGETQSAFNGVFNVANGDV